MQASLLSAESHSTPSPEAMAQSKSERDAHLWRLVRPDEEWSESHLKAFDARRFEQYRRQPPPSAAPHPFSELPWVQGRVRIRAFAHDRITACAYGLTAGGSPPKRHKSSEQRERSRLRILDLRRESRRGYRVASKMRYLPPSTCFSSWARNFVKDAATVLERSGDGVAWFYTFTFPGGTPEALEVYSAASGYLVDRLNRWLRYKTDGSNYVYVWELQKQGRPHLHYLFRLAESQQTATFFLAAQAEWRRILLDVQHDTGVCLFTSPKYKCWESREDLPVVDAGTIASSVCNYIAKYVSKERTKSGGRHTWRPGRWWGCSYALRKQVLVRRLDVIVKFEREPDAQNFIPALTALLQEAQIEPFISSKAKEFGVQLISASTSFNRAKEIAVSLCEWAMFGDITAWNEIKEGANGLRFLARAPS